MRYTEAKSKPQAEFMFEPRISSSLYLMHGERGTRPNSYLLAPCNKVARMRCVVHTKALLEKLRSESV